MAHHRGISSTRGYDKQLEVLLDSALQASVALCKIHPNPEDYREELQLG
jgi:hypothetical protein